MKKLLSLLLCAVLALALPLSVYAAKENNTLGVEFSATPASTTVTNDQDQTVVVEINANKEFDVDGVQAYFTYFPDGIKITKIASTDSDLNYGGSDVNLKYNEAEGIAKVGWTQADVETVQATNLFEITLSVPAGTTPGSYEFKVYGFELSANFLRWENAAEVTYTIVVEEPTVPTATVPTAVTGLTYDGTTKTGVPEGEGYTITGNTATNAGTYTATATLEEGYVWSDGSTEPKQIEWSIAKAVIDAPAPATGLEYNGSEQTGVPAGEGYTVTGNTGTNAGSYVATATADNNHTFADGDSVEVPWVIERAKIEDPEPTEGLVYNGKEQTGIADGEGYTVVSGGKGTDAGSYTAELQADANHEFSNGTQSMAVDWEIEQAELEDSKLELAVDETKALDDDEGLSYELGDDAEGIIELDENGNVKGLAEGTATIIVSSNGEGNYGRGQATITVTVTKTPPTGDMTGRYIIIGCAALVVLAAYLFITKRKEQE